MPIAPTVLPAIHHGRFIPPNTSATLKVVGVYRHGITLLGGGRDVVYLTWLNKPGPFTVYTPGLGTLMSRFQTVQTASISAEQIQIPAAGALISLSSATVFPEIIINPLAERTWIAAAIRQTTRLAQQMQLSASDCLNAYLTLAHHMPVVKSPGENLTTETLQKLVAGILFYQQSHDSTALQQTFLSLLGLGIGLTPAGDDFIAGWLAARNLTLQHASSDTIFSAEVIDQIVEQAAVRTHQLSSALIWAAAQGEIDATLKQILVHLLSGKAVQAEQLTQLAQSGYSSGLDGLAGALCCLEYYWRSKPDRPICIPLQNN